MYPRLRRACLLALCVVGSPTGANAQASECYDAEFGPWRPVPSESEVRSMPLPTESGDSLVYSFPPRVRLNAGGTIVVPEGALPTMHSRTRWALVDSVMEFSLSMDHYAGLYGEMVRTAQGWTGTAKTTSHLIGLQRYEQSLVLSRVDCDSPPPVPASADVDLPLQVVLDDGRAFAVCGSQAATLGRTSIAPAQAIGVYRGAIGLEIRHQLGEPIDVMEVFFEHGGAQAALARIGERWGANEEDFKVWSNRSGNIVGTSSGDSIVIRCHQPLDGPWPVHDLTEPPSRVARLLTRYLKSAS